MTSVKVKITLDQAATLPQYQTLESAGMDLTSTEEFELAPMERRAISTGIKIALPPGYEAQIRPRSGLALKHGLAMVNAPGTIDSDYRGEIRVLLVNLGQNSVKFSVGDRIAQMIVAPVSRAEWEIVTELDDSARGAGGFGSTGL